MTTSTDLAPFAERVHQTEADRVRVLALPTPVDRVVSFTGSLRTNPDFASGEEVTQKLAVMLLDKGTRRQDRFAVAEALEDRGAQLRFSADGLRCSFSGRCLQEDLPEVLALAAEQLREPLFDADEFRKAKAQQVASVRRSMDDTGSQAHGLLARRLYGPAHPNYRPTAKEDLDRLEALTVEEVASFHADHFGASDAVVTLIGDLEADSAAEVVRAHFGGWPPPPAAAPFAAAAEPASPGRADHAIADRQNLDVRIGHPLALRRDADDYLALYVAVFILGGNFSARLMSTVRDEQGLTYGIGAGLSGVSVEHDGYFRASVTLSRENLTRGIEATLEQIRLFVGEGITPAELAEKQTTITGSFKVGLATTGGLAAALLANAERGFPVDYLDRFPALIEALTPPDINAAIERHLDPLALHVAVAGTLPE